ncbi:MAG: STAS domain-containing protein [Gammaproteobacteria bacterium]|nr:STAS domain-containing protein [Gammaproteobacteria bacterium]
MSITSRFLDEAQEYQVILSGRFDFSQLSEFRDAYENAPAKAKKYAIDMRAVEMIDSSALGMLLKMKRSLNLADGEIVITNCSNDVEKILKIAKFDLMFSIQ